MDLNGSQFEQLSLPGIAPAAPTARAAAPDTPGRAPESPGQLPMIMRARDIADQYEPWVGDRQDSSGWQQVKTTGGSPVMTNVATDSKWGEYGEGGPRPKTHYVRGAESDSELWDRKYREGSVAVQQHVPDPDNDYGSLLVSRSHHDVLREKGIEHPIPLGEASGKPMLAGGHHRVAWAMKEAPDSEVPVVHIEPEDLTRWGPEHGGMVAGPTQAQRQMRFHGGYR